MRLLAAALCSTLCIGPAQAATLLAFGEVHDQPDQQRQVADEVQRLAAAGRLAAVVLEMAETPHTTAGLPRDASEAQARQALQWRGWPWEAYAVVVMNAVRAGVPVLGGNLPRGEMRTTMADASLDATLPPAARERIAQAVRDGHCQLLPEAQVPGMVRVQIARDRSLAATAARAAGTAGAEQTVLLLAGAQHVARDRGMPLHLPAAGGSLPLRVVVFGEHKDTLAFDERRDAQFTPQVDHCEGLRRSLGAGDAASAPR